MDEWELSLRDALRALEVDPTSAKSWYRKGIALMHLEEHASSLQCFEEGLELTPGSRKLQDCVRDAQAKVRAAFQRGRLQDEDCAQARADFDARGARRLKEELERDESDHVARQSRKHAWRKMMDAVDNQRKHFEEAITRRRCNAGASASEGEGEGAIVVDFYEMLGLDKRCSAVDVRKAYLKAVARAHPDKGGDRQKFEAIQCAYHMLSSRKLREDYDASLASAAAAVAETSGRPSASTRGERGARTGIEVTDRDRGLTPEQHAAMSLASAKKLAMFAESQRGSGKTEASIYGYTNALRYAAASGHLGEDFALDVLARRAEANMDLGLYRQAMRDCDLMLMSHPNHAHALFYKCLGLHCCRSAAEWRDDDDGEELATTMDTLQGIDHAKYLQLCKLLSSP